MPLCVIKSCSVGSCSSLVGGAQRVCVELNESRRAVAFIELDDGIGIESGCTAGKKVLHVPLDEGEFKYSREKSRVRLTMQ